MDKLVPEKILREQIVGVTGATWWNWKRAGRLDGLPVITIGTNGRRFYRQEDIDRWLSALSTGNAA